MHYILISLYFFYRFVKLASIDEPAERCRNAFHADLVESESHDTVELPQDERQAETLSVLHLSCRDVILRHVVSYHVISACTTTIII